MEIEEKDVACDSTLYTFSLFSVHIRGKYMYVIKRLDLIKWFESTETAVLQG